MNLAPPLCTGIARTVMTVLPGIQLPKHYWGIRPSNLPPNLIGQEEHLLKEARYVEPKLSGLTARQHIPSDRSWMNEAGHTSERNVLVTQ